MPSYLDLGLIVVIFISAILAMLRGFTREFLAIASWTAAALAAYYFYPLALPYVTPHISKPVVAQAVSAAGVFFVTLIVVSLITVRLSDAILDSKVGALDRSLGFVFGAVRGLLLCAIAFIFFNFLVEEKKQPDWVLNARMRPLLAATDAQIRALLPEDPDGLLSKFKPKAATGEEAPSEDADIKPAPVPAPAAKPDNGKHT
jgi:membrane protein required for colicin V production